LVAVAQGNRRCWAAGPQPADGARLSSRRPCGSAVSRTRARRPGATVVHENRPGSWRGDGDGGWSRHLHRTRAPPPWRLDRCATAPSAAPVPLSFWVGVSLAGRGACEKKWKSLARGSPRPPDRRARELLRPQPSSIGPRLARAGRAPWLATGLRFMVPQTAPRAPQAPRRTIRFHLQARATHTTARLRRSSGRLGDRPTQAKPLPTAPTPTMRCAQHTTTPRQ
jgi:hypothetical protein